MRFSLLVLTLLIAISGTSNASASSPLDWLYGSHTLLTKDGASIVSAVEFSDGRRFSCDATIQIGSGDISKGPVVLPDGTTQTVSYPANAFDPDTKKPIATEQLLINSGIRDGACDFYSAQIYADRGAWVRGDESSEYTFSGKVARAVTGGGFKIVSLKEKIRIEMVALDSVQISIVRTGDDGSFEASWVLHR